MNDYSIRELGFKEGSREWDNLYTRSYLTPRTLSKEEIEGSFSLTEVRRLLGKEHYESAMRELASCPEHLIKGTLPHAKGAVLRIKKEALTPFIKRRGETMIAKLEAQLKGVKELYSDYL